MSGDKVGDPGGFCPTAQAIVPLYNVTPEGTSTCDWCDGVHRVSYRWGGLSWDDIPVAKTLTCEGVTVGQVGNSNGRLFRVRLVRKGDTYGASGRLVHDSDDPLVEFYDVTYAGDDRFTQLGQYVSRYSLSQLDGTGRYSSGRIGDTPAGLDLDGGVPEWFLDAPAAGAALRWAEAQMKAGQ